MAPAPALLVRTAAPADAAAIAAIYNEGIADRVATFETRERSADDVRAWLDEGLPFLVATVDDGVVGWARVAPYSDRCVYSGVGEHGVYVARAARGDGVGRGKPAQACPAAGAAAAAAAGGPSPGGAPPRGPPASTSSRRGSSPTTNRASPRTPRPA